MRIAAAAFCAFIAPAAWAQAPAEVPLITNGQVSVTKQDFDAFLLRVPEKDRATFQASMERVGKTVELVYGNRVIAEEAKKAGLDRDPLVRQRMKQIEEAYLAQLWTEDFQRSVSVPDFSKRAEELYTLNRDRYAEPERVTARFIVILKRNRTREEALAKAADLRAKAIAEGNFDALVAANTEDPRFGRNQGRMRRITRKDLEGPIADAVFALGKAGDITQPMETADAVLIARLEAKAPARTRAFAEVKREIIEAERQRYLAEASNRRIGELKNTPSTKVYEQNISALRKDLPVEKLEAVAREKPAAAPAK
jgi:parvulin-like peptidyl-prolyl isomerase